MQMKKRLYSFTNALYFEMKRETAERQKRLKRKYTMTDFVRDGVTREVEVAKKERGEK